MPSTWRGLYIGEASGARGSDFVRRTSAAVKRFRHCAAVQNQFLRLKTRDIFTAQKTVAPKVVCFSILVLHLFPSGKDGSAARQFENKNEIVKDLDLAPYETVYFGTIKLTQEGQLAGQLPEGNLQ